MPKQARSRLCPACGNFVRVTGSEPPVLRAHRESTGERCPGSAGPSRTLEASIRRRRPSKAAPAPVSSRKRPAIPSVLEGLTAPAPKSRKQPPADPVVAPPLTAAELDQIKQSRARERETLANQRQEGTGGKTSVRARSGGLPGSARR